MRPESAGHRRVPLIELRSSWLPVVHGPSGPAAMLQPRGLRLPTHTEPHQSSLPGKTPRQKKGRMLGLGEAERVTIGAAAGGVR